MLDDHVNGVHSQNYSYVPKAQPYVSYQGPKNNPFGYQKIPSYKDRKRSENNQNFSQQDMIDDFNFPSQKHQKSNQPDSSSFFSSTPEEERVKADHEAGIVRAYAIYEEARRRERKKTAFLLKHGYVFKPSEEVDHQLKKSQLELQKINRTYSDTNFFSYDYWFTNKMKELRNQVFILQKDENGAKENIKRQKKEWETQSLQEIVYKENGRVLKEAADKIKAEEELIERKRVNAELLIKHGYAFQLSKKLDQEIQDTQNQLQAAVHDSENISYYDSYLTYKRSKLQVDIKTLTQQKQNLKENVWKERQVSEVDFLQDLAEKENDLIASTTKMKDSEKKFFYKNQQCMQGVDLNNVSQYELKLVHSLPDIIVESSNDTTLELAQASLRSWVNAQRAENDDDHKIHMKKSQELYDKLEEEKLKLSMVQQASKIKKSDVDNLLNDYTVMIQDCKQDQSINPTVYKRIEKRSQALIESQEQLSTNNLSRQNHELSSQARGFMMANNMNYQSFNNAVLTNFQHCLTDELVEVVESSASAVEKHGKDSIAGQLAYHNCNIAVSAQQLNQSSKIEEAVALADMTHLFELCAKILCKNEIGQEILVGALLGVKKSAEGWFDFGKRLQDDPKKTVNKIAYDTYEMAHGLAMFTSQIASVGGVSSMEDLMQDNLNFLEDCREYCADKTKPGPFDNLIYKRQQRRIRDLKVLKDTLKTVLGTSKAVIQKMMSQTLRENVADVTVITVDTLVTNKIFDGLQYITKIIGSQAVKAVDVVKDIVPPASLPSFATNAGEFVGAMESAGEAFSGATQVSEQAIKLSKYTAQAKNLSDKISAATNPDPKEVAEFQKSIDPFLNSEKIINVKSLKSIKDVDQIEKYRDYTNNFHPEGLAKLKPEEILHLNLCDWLAPKAIEINERIRKAGGLKISETRNGIEYITEIYELDLFHSLLGEMRPGSVRDATKGGHLFIAELKSATFDIGDIKSFGSGFFDMDIKHLRGFSDKYKTNSFFKMGTSVDKVVEMIEDAIKNSKDTIFMGIADNGRISFDVINKSDQIFALHIKDKIAKIHPVNPSSRLK